MKVHGRATVHDETVPFASEPCHGLRPSRGIGTAKPWARLELPLLPRR